jgi:hypothetical protein
MIYFKSPLTGYCYKINNWNFFSGEEISINRYGVMTLEDDFNIRNLNLKRIPEVEYLISKL